MSKVAIDFHRWMMKNDTMENADKYFHWSDDDMFKEFLKHKNPTNSNDIPHSEIRRMESEGVLEKFDKSNSSSDSDAPKYFNTICYDEWNGEKPKDIQDWEETSFGKAHKKFTKDIGESNYDDVEDSDYDSISIPKDKPYNDDEYDY